MHEIHRVYCATPWEIDDARLEFNDAVGRFNETTGGPKGVLYVPLALPAVRDKRPLQRAVNENIQSCRHFILGWTGDWGPPERNLRRDLTLALDCAADPSRPMREIAILTERGSAASPDEIPAPFAEFSNAREFGAVVERLLASWLDSLLVESHNLAKPRDKE